MKHLTDKFWSFNRILLKSVKDRVRISARIDHQAPEYLII